MKKLLLIALSTFAVSAHAWEPTYYAGSSLAAWQYKQNNPTPVDSNFSLYSIEGVAGVTLTPYTSVEARAGFGLNTGREATNSGLGHSEVEMPYFGSLYFRPHLTNEKASLYGLLGMTTVSLETVTYEATTNSRSEEVSALSYGIGVSFVASPNIDVTAEWKKLINAEAFDIRGASLGFVYRF